MSASQVRTYAGVAFETALKDWLDGLGHVVAAFSRTPGLQSRLADQTLGFEERQSMLLALLPGSMPAPVRNFLLAMVANGDITLLDEVFEELNGMAAAGGGPRPVTADVVSAIALTSDERRAIQNRLVDQFGPNLEFRFKVDPAILGGLVLRVGDKLIDTSLASRMSALRQSLGRTGS